MTFVFYIASRNRLFRDATLLWLILLLLVICSNQIFSQESDSRNLSLSIHNSSCFAADIYEGSYGGKQIGQVLPFEVKQLNFYTRVKDNDEIIFYYYLDLDYDSLHVDQIQSKDQYFTIKPQNLNTQVEINPPKMIETDNVFFSIQNKSVNVLSIIHANSLITFKQGKYDIGISIPAKKSASFIKRISVLGDMQIYDTQIFFPKIEYKKSWVYSFIYDGTIIYLTDARPLNKIGEPSWSIELEGLNQPVSLLDSTEMPITYVASGEKGTALYTITDKGTAIVKEARAGATDVNAKSILRTGDGKYLLAGFEEENDSAFISVIQKQSSSGAIEWSLPRSKRKDCVNQYILAAASDGVDGWLSVGGGKSAFDENYSAYACAFHDNAKTGSIVWELGPKDFPVDCGRLRAVAYDSVRKLWVIAGDYQDNTTGVNSDDSVASYYATVSEEGKIVKLDTSLKGIVINKVLAGTEGIYLVGEERKAGEGYAVVLKYGADGTQVWKQSDQLKSFSYYQDAVLDETNDRILLVGTTAASNEYGEGGKPCLQSVSLSTGKESWLETYEKFFPGAEVIAGVVRAPEYGYLLSISGVSDDGVSSNPYILARVNECGKLIDLVKRSEK